VTFEQADPGAWTSMLARADHQHAQVVAAFDGLVVARARELLATCDPIVAWSVLQRELHKKLGDSPNHVRFLAELLAAAALRQATGGSDA
jgi:hypothetical protein